MARSALGCNRVGVGCRGSCTGGGGGERLRGGCLLLRLRRLGRLGLGGPVVVSWGSWGGWADFVGAGYGGHAQCDNSSNGGAAMGCLAGEGRLGILFGVFAAVVFIELECFGCLLQEFGCMTTRVSSGLLSPLDVTTVAWGASSSNTMQGLAYTQMGMSALTELVCIV
jgi:hypothetical protein